MLISNGTFVTSECFDCRRKAQPTRSLCRSEKSPFAAKRLNNVIEFLTYEVFRYTCRGLYENHKFLLVLFLTLKKDLQTGHVKHQEFQVFIKGQRSGSCGSSPRYHCCRRHFDHVVTDVIVSILMLLATILPTLELIRKLTVSFGVKLKIFCMKCCHFNTDILFEIHK